MKKIKLLVIVVTSIFLISCMENNSDVRKITSPFNQCLGLDPETKYVIFNADDVGFSIASDLAVFDLYDRGLVQSVSVMAGGPSFGKAREMIKEREMSVGIHLFLTSEWPDIMPLVGVLPKKEVPSLYNKQGTFWSTTEELLRHADMTDVKKELVAQVEAILKHGIPVTHIDTHMLIMNLNLEFLEVVVDIMEEHSLVFIPQMHGIDIQLQKSHVRDMRIENGVVPDSYKMIYFPKRASKNLNYATEKHVEHIKSLEPGVHHMVVHPAIIEDGKNSLFPDINVRYSDYLSVTSEEVNRIMSQPNYEFINYDLLHKLQQSIFENSVNNCMLD